jgi:hypothetical protein
MQHSAPPSRTPILVIGNSHTTAIAAALQAEADTAIQVVNIAVEFDPVNRKNKFLPADIAAHYQPKRIYCSFGGSEHNVFGLLEAPARFDFMTPQSDKVEPDRQIVPYGVVRATLARAMGTAFANLTALRKAFACPIKQLCTPPPFRQLGPKHILPRVFHDKLHLGIAPPSLRRKLHLLHSALAKEKAMELGIETLETPTTCSDADGYLLPEYWGKDPTHGNARYGTLVLRQIRDDTRE